jgi:lipopolysaccharide biosynthesis glycosyltransferase
MSLHVAFCHQGATFYGLAVSIASLLNSCSANQIVIHVHSDLEQAARDQLSFSIKSRFAGTSIRYYPLQLQIFDNFNLDYPKIFYYRLLLPLLHPDIDKIIYLDTDLIIEKDLQELYSIETIDIKIAAVRDHIEQRKCEDLKVSPPYINSGVMLMNLKALREFDFTVKCFNWLNLNCGRGLSTHDQDAINVYLQTGGVRLLNGDWNDMLPRPESFLSPKSRIIHITGPFKPWHEACPIIYQERFLNYYTTYISNEPITFLKTSNSAQTTFAANQNRLNSRFSIACQFYEQAFALLREENSALAERLEQPFERLQQLLNSGRAKCAADLGAACFQSIGYAADAVSPFQYPGILK